MATGKTTVGKLTAARMKWTFFDMDEEICCQAGLSVREIFDRYGEDYFRNLETRLLQSLLRHENIVIATGGGTLVREENRHIALAASVVICLTAPIELLHERLTQSSERPLAKSWYPLWQKRRTIYDGLPHHIDTSGKTPEKIAQEITFLWSSLWNNESQ